MENYNWDKAQVAKVGARSKEERVIIRANGTFHLNSAFIRNNDIISKKYVKALIIKGEDKTAIGLVFLNKEEKGESLTLAWGKNKINAGFSGRSILSEAKINLPEKSIILPPKIQEYNDDKIYVIELKK